MYIFFIIFLINKDNVYDSTHSVVVSLASGKTIGVAPSPTME
jgi:hypothetical protein